MSDRSHSCGCEVRSLSATGSQTHLSLHKKNYSTSSPGFVRTADSAAPVGSRGSPVHPLHSLTAGAFSGVQGEEPIPLQRGCKAMGKAATGRTQPGVGRAAAGRRLHLAAAVSCAVRSPCPSKRGILWLGGARERRALARRHLC